MEHENEWDKRNVSQNKRKCVACATNKNETANENSDDDDDSENIRKISSHKVSYHNALTTIQKRLNCN